MTSHRTVSRKWLITPLLVVAVWAVLPLCAASTAPAAAPSLRMPALFTDHMVLQRDEPVAVWGWADPALTVMVRIAGQTKTATADDQGRWTTTLDPLPAGGPLEMTVAADGTIVIADILVGEVWICSGQSNMWWPLDRTDDAAAQVPKANHPRLRLFTVTRELSPREVRTDCKGRWQACTPAAARKFSAVAYYFGRSLLTGLDVPVGLIHASWGATRVETWTSRPALTSTAAGSKSIAQWEQRVTDWDEPTAMARYERQLADWEVAAETADTEGRQPPRKPRKPVDPLKSPSFPASLYNAMIAPVAPYAIRGAIWYQGESNAGRPDAYREVFPAMIRDWRKVWGKPEMPFYFVQLANFVTPARWGPANWANIREAQAAALKLPGTGMAVAIDIGDAKNIHPGNKLDVGRRLSLWALAKIHGRKVAYSGPVYRSMKRDGASVRLQFDHADGLATKDGALRTFQIAGDDRVFHPARAAIDGDSVVVAGENVPDPVAVRYAWASNPDRPNLYNVAGLPAVPFRTDTWTEGEK